MKKALLIGRFQPFHNGHLDLVKQVINLGIKKIIIGIGTSKNGRTMHDPFTYEECVQMIKPVLDDVGVDYCIYQIQDINDPPNYAKHVKTIIPELDNDTLIVSGNPYTYNCFKEDYPIFIPNEKDNTHATGIRELILKNKPYRKYVPPETCSVLEKINAGKLLQSFS